MALRPGVEPTVSLMSESEGISESANPLIAARMATFAREIGTPRGADRVQRREFEIASAQLRDTCIATMKALAQVVEEKDATTRGHLERTQRYGMTLAGKIDAQMAGRPDLACGFFLHDIGKMGIPERVLCKPSPLTEAEWKVMRAHPIIGADIVRPIPFLAGAIDIIISHHERFDGGGYPAGLKGEQIPAEARIFAVVDAFDAMTSDRPYRDALYLDEALERIRLAAGSQLDPTVVEAFLELVEEGQIGLLPGRLLSDPAPVAV